MALKIQDLCGPTSYESLVHYASKKPCYNDLARTTDELSGYWFICEFENPNSLKACLDLNGTLYKNNRLTVRALTHKEYDDTCGLLGIMKDRTKRLQKTAKDRKLSLVLVSNVSSRVTADVLYKFFCFSGDPIELAIDRVHKLALIAYATEAEALIAVACDQAMLGPALVRIELYLPKKHGPALQNLLKVTRTGDIAHVGPQTGYVQISEVGCPVSTGRAPQSVAQPPSSQQKPQQQTPSKPNAPAGNPYSQGWSPNQPTQAKSSSQAHPGPSHSQQAPQGWPPGYVPPKSYNNPPQPSYPPHQGQHGQQPLPSQQHSSQLPPTSPRDWSSIVPTAKYQVTTEFK